MSEKRDERQVIRNKYEVLLRLKSSDDIKKPILKKRFSRVNDIINNDAISKELLFDKNDKLSQGRQSPTPKSKTTNSSNTKLRRYSKLLNHNHFEDSIHDTLPIVYNILPSLRDTVHHSLHGTFPSLITASSTDIYHENSYNNQHQHQHQHHHQQYPHQTQAQSYLKYSKKSKELLDSINSLQTKIAKVSSTKANKINHSLSSSLSLLNMNQEHLKNSPTTTNNNINNSKNILLSNTFTNSPTMSSPKPLINERYSLNQIIKWDKSRRNSKNYSNNINNMNNNTKINNINNNDMNNVIDIYNILGDYANDLNIIIEGNIDKILNEYKAQHLCESFNETQHIRISLILEMIEKIFIKEFTKKTKNIITNNISSHNNSLNGSATNTANINGISNGTNNNGNIYRIASNHSNAINAQSSNDIDKGNNKGDSNGNTNSNYKGNSMNDNKKNGNIIDNGINNDQQIYQELWLLLKNDINQCINTYNSYIVHLDNIRKKLVSDNCKPIYLEHDIIHAFNILYDYGQYILNHNTICSCTCKNTCTSACLCMNHSNIDNHDFENTNDDVDDIIEHDTNFTSNENVNVDNIKNIQKVQKYKNDIFTVKINYKSLNSHNPKLIEIFERFEKYFNSLNNLIQTKNSQINELNIQCNKYLQKNKELIQAFEEKNKQIITYTKQMQETTFSPTSLLIDNIGKDYRERISRLEEEISKLMTDNENLQLQLKSYKFEKSRIDLLKSEHNNKAIQVDLNFINVPSEIHINNNNNPHTPYKLLDIIHNNKENSFIGVTQNIQWTCCIINLIYNNKIICDLLNDHDKRCRKQLDVFTIEWFLKKYGLYNISDIILKDFTYNIKKYAPYYERVRLFAHLCGIPFSEALNLKKPLISNNSSGNKFDGIQHEFSLSRYILQQEYFKTSEAISILLKILTMIKLAKTSEPSYKFTTILEDNNSVYYRPMLPISIDLKNDMIPAELAQNIVYDIFHEMDIKLKDHDNTLHDKFLRIHSNDISIRELEENIKEQKVDNYVKNIDKEMIRLDYFLLELMEFISEQKIIIIERFYTILQIHTKQTEINITYEDFYKSIIIEYPNQTDEWYGNVYTHLFINHQSADKIPFVNLMKNIIPLLYNSDIYKPAYTTMQTFSMFNKPNTSSQNRDKRVSIIMARKASINPINIMSPTSGTPTNLHTLLINKNPLATNNQSTFQNNQSTLQNNTNNNNNGTQNKIVYCPNDQQLNNICFQIYDVISSAYMLYETYQMIQDAINDHKNVKRLLQQFQDEINADFIKLQIQAIRAGEYEKLQSYRLIDTINFIELMWKKMRWLIQLCFKKSHDSIDNREKL